MPSQGDITTLRIIHQMRQDLSFSEEEHEALQFKKTGETMEDGTIVPDGQIRWRTEAETQKDVEFKPKAHAIIAKRLEELNKQQKLMEAHIPLYEKFVEEKE